jgi:hypothetical protein
MVESLRRGEVEIGGLRYIVTIGNDDRDGLFVEVFDPEWASLLQVYRPLNGGSMTVATLAPDVTVDVVEYAIAVAKAELRWRWEDDPPGA